jgi:formylmethanofuran dehydrogenase subunit E-like metal-binding protein
MSFAMLVRSVARAWLINTLPASTPADLERMVFFHQHIVLGCISGYLREAPPRLTRKAFIRDLSRISIGYIESCRNAAKI